MSPKPAVLSLCFVALLLGATAAQAAPTVTVLHTFGGTNPGDDPDALIQASDGNFYGITYLGVGIVFKVTPDGQVTTIFTGTHTDPFRYFYGNFFTGLVEGSDGLLYVTERGSNNNPNPTLFRITKSGTNYQVVLNEAPNSLATASDGNFYGVDGNGIFRLSTSGTYTVLSTNTGGLLGFNNQSPDGNFYGTCYSNWYHACRVTTSGQVTPIFAFPTGTNVRDPIFLTQGSDGFLYGVALESNYATEVIFQLSTSGSYRELYTNPNGCGPKSGCSRVIQASDGNLWITNPTGQSVYSITPTGGALLQTVPFGISAHPQILVQGSSGILYGTTGEPCPCYNNPGSVFSINANLPPK